MTEKQDSPEYVTIYRTAQEMLRRVESRHPDARVTDKLTAGDVTAMCEFVIHAVEASYPIIHLSGAEFLFWTCPNGCRGGVSWASRVAVCQTCGASSQSRLND